MDVDAPRYTLRERQRQEREELILRAAEAVLLEKGYHETSMEEIAARVGIAKGTVYLHFASKEDLIQELFRRDMQQMLQEIDTLIASSATAREKLSAVLRQVYGGMLHRRFRLLSLLYDSPGSRQALLTKKESLRQYGEQIAQRILVLVEEGQARGLLSTRIPSVVLQSAFFGLLSPHVYDRLVTQAHIEPDDLVTYLEDVYFHGVACNKATENHEL